MCVHIWDRYQFNGEKGFLKRLYPVLKGCVQFLVDFLVEDESGKYLVTNPSLSPENTFWHEDKTQGVLCEGSTIDIQIISAVLGAFISIVSELGSTDDLLDTVKQCRGHLPPMKIGNFGQLQEWQQDYTEVEPGMSSRTHSKAVNTNILRPPTYVPSLGPPPGQRNHTRQDPRACSRSSSCSPSQSRTRRRTYGLESSMACKFTRSSL